MTVADRIVFDAEPLIAHADGEPGSDVVEEYLDAVAVEDAIGYLDTARESRPSREGRVFRLVGTEH